MALAASTAREIIKQAKADDTFEGAIPESDAEVIKAAEELVEMAEQAWAQQIRGPEVEAILKLAAKEQNGGGEDQGESDAGSETPEPEAKSEPSKPDDDDKIITPSIFSGLDKKRAKAEPYEGYGDERVADITSAIVWYVDDSDQSPDEVLDVLKDIWAYESAHKDRVRILKFIVEAAKRKGWIEQEQKEEGSGSGSEPSSEPDDAEAGGGESENEAESTQEADAEADSSSEESRPTPETEASSEDSNADDDAKSETRESSGQGRKADTEATQQGEGDGSERSAYQKLVKLVDEQLSRERLDIPKPPSEDVPELPWRWAEISDEQLQNFHMQFAALAYYKSYIKTREERIGILCKQAADEIHNALYNAADKYDEKGKQRTATALTAEIESDDRVKRWRKRQRLHDQYALAAKNEMDSYYKLVEALSRLESMRHNAWERSR